MSSDQIAALCITITCITWGIALGAYLDDRGVRLPKLLGYPVTMTHRLITRALDRLAHRKDPTP